jgi:hypothetical protein
MLLTLTSLAKKLYIFSFFIVFIGIFLFTNLSKAEKMLFTEGQQEFKNQNQTQSFKEPEWDGLYVVDNSGNYHELISLSEARGRRMKGLTREYFLLIVLPQEINRVSWNNFKGFFIKGPQLIREIEIKKAKYQPLGKKFSFLYGMPGGEQFQIYDFHTDIYTTQMRCKTKLDSSYCEFKDKELIKKYLKDDVILLKKSPNDGAITSCLFITVGESPKHLKGYIVCFEE